MSETLQAMIFHPASQFVIGVDQILRGQGADPNHTHYRNPRLVQLVQRAIEVGLPLISPVAVYRRLETLDVKHESLRLSDGHALRGALIGQHLNAAEAVNAVVCTIGSGLEEAISTTLKEDPPFGLALDGFGTAAVEALANDACRFLERKAAEREMQTSIPLSPGMIGWPVDQGQAQLFRILDTETIGVTLNTGCMMTPKKSLSFVIGEGSELNSIGNACDYCMMRDTCRYQDHYDQELCKA